MLLVGSPLTSEIRCVCAKINPRRGEIFVHLFFSREAEVTSRIFITHVYLHNIIILNNLRYHCDSQQICNVYISPLQNLQN